MSKKKKYKFNDKEQKNIKRVAMWEQLYKDNKLNEWEIKFYKGLPPLHLITAKQEKVLNQTIQWRKGYEYDTKKKLPPYNAIYMI